MPQNLRQLTKILQRRVLFSSKAPKTGSFFVRFSQRWAFVQTLQNTFYRTSLFLESLETIKNSPFRMKYAASFAPQPENLPRYVICADVPKHNRRQLQGQPPFQTKTRQNVFILKTRVFPMSRKNPQKRQASADFLCLFCTDYRWESMSSSSPSRTIFPYPAGMMK